jgi:hypothetical protein
MDTIVAQTPADKELHVILDNYCTHKKCDARFSKNGSSSSLGAAMASYVGGNGGGIRSGSRGGGGGGSGARRAMQRMGASRGAGARLLGVVRDFQQLGAADVLRRLDLDGMVNQPAADVFVAMLEFLCPPAEFVNDFETPWDIYLVCN